MYTYVPVFNEVSKVHIEGLIADYKKANEVYYARPLPKKSYFVNLKFDNGSVEIRDVYLKPVSAGVDARGSEYSVQVRDLDGEIVFKTNLTLKKDEWPLPDTDGILTHIDGFEYAVMVPYSVDASRVEVLKNNKLEDNVSVEVFSETCGDEICSLVETHLDCPQDCDIHGDGFCETSKCDGDCPSQVDCEGKKTLKWIGIILIVVVFLGIVVFVLKRRKEFLKNSGVGNSRARG